jgi:hypothetical protein
VATQTNQTNALNLSLISSIGGNPPAGWTVLTSSASAPTQQAEMYAANGLSGTAYFNAQTNQIIVAFAGIATVPTFLNSGTITSGPLATGATNIDTQILNGNPNVTATMQAAVNAFMQQVQNSASQLATPFDISAANTSVTGLSIGGVYAQLGAQFNDLSLGGASYGAPGIPGNTTVSNPESNFLNYAAPGDAIPQLASDGSGQPFLVASGTQDSTYHYGTPVITLGPPGSNVGIATDYAVITSPLDPDSQGAQLGAELDLLLSTKLTHNTATYESLFGMDPTNDGSSSSGSTPTDLDDLLGPAFLERMIDGGAAPLTFGTNSSGATTFSGPTNNGTTFAGTTFDNAANGLNITFQESTPQEPIAQTGTFTTAVTAMGNGVASYEETAAGSNPFTVQAFSQTSAAGTPESSIQIDLDTGTNPTTTVVATDGDGTSVTLDLSGIATVSNAFANADNSATASGSGLNILVGADGSDLTDTSSGAIFFDLGNGGQTTTGANAQVIDFGNSK